MTDNDSRAGEGELKGSEKSNGQLNADVEKGSHQKPYMTRGEKLGYFLELALDDTMPMRKRTPGLLLLAVAGLFILMMMAFAFPLMLRLLRGI